MELEWEVGVEMSGSCMPVGSMVSAFSKARTRSVAEMKSWGEM